MDSIIKAENRIDIIAAGKLEQLLKEKMETTDGNLCIDFSDTNYICSVGLRTLLSTTKAMRKKGKDVILRGVNSQVMEVFEITGFSGIFKFE